MFPQAFGDSTAGRAFSHEHSIVAAEIELKAPERSRRCLQKVCGFDSPLLIVSHIVTDNVSKGKGLISSAFDLCYFFLTKVAGSRPAQHPGLLNLSGV